MSGVAIPGLEAGIAASLVVAGLLLVSLARLPTGSGTALATGFALFHGIGHGAELSAAAIPALYAFGFMAMTAMLFLAGTGLARLAQQARALWLLRGVGMLSGGCGAWLLFSA